ncbi:zinc-binding dehydrogenase [Catenuloplanes atrovinosus]|uniref:Threonine dehydrogenase-like Zn-dependent dehydrogenase n=1 Tax=Catenuloplanes atrovinosus TaxID=137266 RepID=A0AAE3YNK3_9ACTN|nr:zinc-binding dehydrogenase [Catenuloplanes atrovinosus]MDR7275493.1 threonine dehydrogenase-like Zn-dependent dehydrogenase [Catenuloplanes atrovinosus]
MRAVVAENGTLTVTEVDTPVPGPGQIRLRVTRAGICGSDLHARYHADAAADATAEIGYAAFMRRHQRVVMGHEFTGTIDAYGPGCRRRWRPGRAVVAVPMIRHGDDVHLTGLSAAAPGAYAEYVLVAEAATFPVPRGVPPDVAALTEPLSVARRAVNHAEITRRDTAVVIGCGPIGLAIILLLRAAGVRTIIAADRAAGRRTLARTCGATHIAPAPWPHLPPADAPALFRAGLDALAALRRVPGLPWPAVMRAATPRGPVVFECVGLPGVIEDIVSHAPFRSRVVVVGVCMQPDTFRPTMASNKELQLRFSSGYSPPEFHDALRLLARGRVDPRPLITDVVPLAGVPAAFDLLASPGHHAKILIDPHL